MVIENTYIDPELYRASLYNKYAIGIASLPGAFFIDFFVNNPDINLFYLIKVAAAILLILGARSIFKRSYEIVRTYYKIEQGDQ